MLPLWPLYTLTQQEPTIDHAKTVVGPQGFTQEPTKKGKENKSKQQPKAALQDITNTNAHEYLQHRNFSQRMNKEVVRCRVTTTIETNNGEAYPAHQLIT